jgi:DNA recombination-dependent growth factor C
MGLMSGALSVRRYRVEGQVPDDFRLSYMEALNTHAFREPGSRFSTEESSGWCRLQNLLETKFDDINHWLMNYYLVAALRVDKKVLPAKLFRARLELRLNEWCEEHGRQKAPSQVRSDLRDVLEQEMLGQTLPRVQVTEWCWNITDGYVIFHNTSDAANDRFRKLFRTTFGLVLHPFTPLDFLSKEPDVGVALESKSMSDLRPAMGGEE